MKKLLSILLATSLIAIVFAGALSVQAHSIEDEIAAIFAVVEAYDDVFHGGIGQLHAEIDMWGEGVIITGEIFGVTRGIVFENSQMDIIWNARISGNTGDEPLISSTGAIVTFSDAEIISNGTALQGNSVHIQGGLVSAPQAITVTNFLMISSGVVQGDVHMTEGFDFRVIGGAVIGSLLANNPLVEMVILDGMVSAPSVFAQGRINLRGTTQFVVDNFSGAEHAIISVASTVTTNLLNQHNNFIFHRNGVYTVVGDVTLNNGEFMLTLDEVLNIPTNASLTINNTLHLAGGTMVIDGILTLPSDYVFTDWGGTITGANAGNLAGSWDRGFNTAWMVDDDCWYNQVPNWLHWMLRWIGFGWLWMCC